MGFKYSVLSIREMLITCCQGALLQRTDWSDCGIGYTMMFCLFLSNCLMNVLKVLPLWIIYVEEHFIDNIVSIDVLLTKILYI